MAEGGNRDPPVFEIGRLVVPFCRGRPRESAGLGSHFSSQAQALAQQTVQVVHRSFS
jgi:hypothetical protein